MQAARALSLSLSSSTALRHSHSHSRTTTRVFTGAILSSSIRWRGRHRCFGAVPVPVPVQSEIEEPKKRKKRISKEERRSLVKAFVDKYRASNAGKYPNTTETQKQVGGSYYTVKNIVQQLEYNSKHAATTTAEKEETLSEQVKASPEARDAPRSEQGADDMQLGRTNESQNTIAISNMDIDESHSNGSQLKQETLSSIEISSSEAANYSSQIKQETLSSIEVSSSEVVSNSSKAKADTLSSSIDVATNSSQVKTETLSSIEMHIAEYTPDIPNTGVPSSSDKTHTRQINLENKEMSHLCTEEPQNSKEAAISDNPVDFDKSEAAKEDREEPTEREKSELPTGIYEESEKQQSPHRPTVWGSLRSFADGIVKLWRKM